MQSSMMMDRSTLMVTHVYKSSGEDKAHKAVAPSSETAAASSAALAPGCTPSVPIAATCSVSVSGSSSSSAGGAAIAVVADASSVSSAVVPAAVRLTASKWNRHKTVANS